jgi:hypothetical protein
MAGTGNLLLKRGTTVPTDGQLNKSMPAVQLFGPSPVSNATGKAYINYPNRLWMGMDGTTPGVNQEGCTGTTYFNFSNAEAGSIGVIPTSVQSCQDTPVTINNTRPLWMGAEIRAFAAVDTGSAGGAPTILEADWANPSDYVLVTQKSIHSWVTSLAGSGTVKLYEDGNPGAEDYIEIKAPQSITTPYTLVYPDQLPTSNAGGKTLSIDQVANNVATLVWTDPGNAASANTVAISTASNNTAYNVTFVNATSGNATVSVDSSGFTYNPSTNTLAAANITGNLTGNLTGNVAGNVSGTAGSLATARNIALGGDLSGNADFDGSSNITISATIQPNSVELGTDTTGNYVATVGVSGIGLSVSGSGQETAGVTISSNADSNNTGGTIVARDGSGNFSAGTITAALSGNATTATNAANVVLNPSGTTVANHIPFSGLSGAATGATTGSLRITSGISADSAASFAYQPFSGPDNSGILLVNSIKRGDNTSTRILKENTNNGTYSILFGDQTGSLRVDSNASDIFRYDSGSQTLYVKNLNVTGAETVTIKQNVETASTYITLNSDLVTDPTESAGLIVNRGSKVDTRIEWNESTGRWEIVTIAEDIPIDSNGISKPNNTSFQVDYDQTNEKAKRVFESGKEVIISGLTGDNGPKYNGSWVIASSGVGYFTVQHKVFSIKNLDYVSAGGSTGSYKITCSGTTSNSFLPAVGETVTISNSGSTSLNGDFKITDSNGATNAVAPAFDAVNSELEFYIIKTDNTLFPNNIGNFAGGISSVAKVPVNSGYVVNNITYTNSKVATRFAYPIVHTSAPVTNPVVDNPPAAVTYTTAGGEPIQTIYNAKLVDVELNNLTMTGIWNLQASINSTNLFDLRTAGFILPYLNYDASPNGYHESNTDITILPEGQIAYDITSNRIKYSRGSGTSGTPDSGNPTANAAAELVDTDATQTLSNKTLTQPKIANNGYIADANGNEQIVFATTGSAANQITITNAASGASPLIASSGDDTHIDLRLQAKGNGTVVIDDSAINTTNGTFSVFNSTATDVSAFGAATVLAIGNTATAGQTVNMFTSSTGASTYNFATGITAASTTKAINIGTNGASNSTTNITLGSATATSAGTTTINSVTTAIAGTTLTASNATSVTLGSSSVASTVTLGPSTAATTINLGTGANASGVTKAINIGTNGANGSTTTITIGSTAATTNTTSNVLLGSATAASSVVQISNNKLLFKNTGNRITLSSAAAISAAATHTLPDITSGNVVIASTSNFNTADHILMGAGTTTPSVYTDKNTVVVGGVKVNFQNITTATTKYPIPFLGSNRSTDSSAPSTFTTSDDGTYVDSYVYANFGGGATGGPVSNFTSGLFYEISDAANSTVGTLFCDYIGATLDCGTY